MQYDSSILRIQNPEEIYKNLLYLFFETGRVKMKGTVNSCKKQLFRDIQLDMTIQNLVESVLYKQLIMGD
ncbi:hypothetical protein Nstercoris_01466 [Nitrosomonas stercoris]|uniref:Uncharacterized protein n=1 Tax=Nitrosomonas stercoris TaxID=1444684 RepID=A0A4Y1YMG0_9PROT|nr:hypothetical protein Nstercoris_01466 [Nitrosomonas stercoris]